MFSRVVTVALTLVAMAGLARAESKGEYRLEGDEDGRPVVVTLTIDGGQARHAIDERIWEGTATREGAKVRLRFEVPIASSTVGVNGALSGEHGGRAADRNVFEGTLVEDANGVVEELANATRKAPEEWSRIRARGAKKDGRLKLGGTLVASEGPVAVFVPIDGTLTVTSSRGEVTLRSPSGALAGHGATVTCEAKELGAWRVELDASSRGGTLAASLVQKGVAKERPWSSHTWYPLFELTDEDGAPNGDTLYAEDGPLDKLDRANGLTGSASSVFWEKGGDYRSSFDLEHGHYTRVARPTEANAELDWKCDLDGDGLIGASPEETFARLDTNKDGVVTADEAYLACYEAVFERLFRDYDSNGDGKLGPDEIGPELVAKWGRGGSLDRSAFRAGVERDHPTLVRGEAIARRDHFLGGAKSVRANDLPRGLDFLDADDVDGDHRDLLDTDNVRVTLKDGSERFGNRVVVADGKLSLFKGPRQSEKVLDGTASRDVKQVLRNIADGRLDGSYDASWWGHCNAWGMAAILFPKPEKPVTVNGVTFSVRDQKGILVELGMGATEDSTFSWDDFGREIDPRRYAAAFHAQLAHWLRAEQKGLLADMELKDPVLGPWPVWNYPLLGYDAQFVEAAGDDPSVLDATVNIEMASYSEDDGSYSKRLGYRLHMGARGEIRDDAASKTDWTTHIVVGGEQKKGYVRYLIHPFRLTGRGASGNPVVTEERVAKVIPSVNGVGR